jgi:hypothetical protein
VADLQQQIADAFPPTKLVASTFAGPHDVWTSYPERNEFEAATDGRTWGDLDGAFVEAHFMALGWMTPSLFAALLPAYLLALVEGQSQNELPDFVLSQLTRREGHEAAYDARVAQLTEQQRAAVAAVLETLPATSRWSHYRAQFDAARASWT